ncbi:hypothetical protein [Tenacibaculum piscium]|uniref:hypothetical protein n=1 Tax=Tenacibaculum piscium TaxID=1458515 RepID=UPI001F243E0E|nr:hypothetical protein [Tenacibaculum piscium]
MKNQNQLNPTESLQIISEAIHQTKENIKEQSFYYIMWGWIIAIASFTHYLLLAFTNLKQSHLVWSILIPLGWILSIIYTIKKEKKLKYETYLDTFLKNLWIVIGVSFFIIKFISFSLKVNPTAFLLLLTGIGTLISGLTMKFKPLAIGGVLLFIFSIISLYVNNSETLLVNGIAIIIGFLIPAYLLKNLNNSN